MYLAYSALRLPAEPNGNHPDQETEILLRYRAYLNVCSKYSHYIAEIQKYFPGWVPHFK
jgi:hypothetical protein